MVSCFVGGSKNGTHVSSPVTISDRKWSQPPASSTRFKLIFSVFARLSFMAGVRRRGTQWALSRTSSKSSLMTRRTMVVGLSVRSTSSRRVCRASSCKKRIHLLHQVASQARMRPAFSLFVGDVGATGFEGSIQRWTVRSDMAWSSWALLRVVTISFAFRYVPVFQRRKTFALWVSLEWTLVMTRLLQKLAFLSAAFYSRVE